MRIRCVLSRRDFAYRGHLVAAHQSWRLRSHKSLDRRLTVVYGDRRTSECIGGAKNYSRTAVRSIVPFCSTHPNNQNCTEKNNSLEQPKFAVAYFQSCHLFVQINNHLIKGNNHSIIQYFIFTNKTLFRQTIIFFLKKFYVV